MQATPNAPGSTPGIFSLMLQIGTAPEATPLAAEGEGAFSNLLGTLLPPQSGSVLPPLDGQGLPPSTALVLPMAPSELELTTASVEDGQDDIATVMGQLNFGAIQVLSPAATKQVEEPSLTPSEQAELAASVAAPTINPQVETVSLASDVDLPEPEITGHEPKVLLPNEKNQDKQAGAKTPVTNVVSADAGKLDAVLAASTNQAEHSKDDSLSFALAKADTTINAAQSKGRPDVLNFEQELNSIKEQDKLQLGPDKKQWGVALGGRILTMVAEETHQAQIRLDPPELGSLHVRMQVQHDQVQIQVQVQTPQVRETLEYQAQRLRDALAESGMQLSQFDVSQQSSQQHGQGQGQGQEQGQPGVSDGEWLSGSEEDNPQSVASVNSHTLLDTFA